MERRGGEESGVEASGMLVVRDTCDKRADNHEDGGVSLPRGLCSAMANRNVCSIAIIEKNLRFRLTDLE